VSDDRCSSSTATLTARPATPRKRVPLYDRLPELYRIRDAEQVPPYPLRSYLALVEDALGHVHANIEQLYDDLFIETCADWVVPYIADLVGTSHLKGDPSTLRADVADTILLRRRKGTRGALELLAFDLTGWGVHVVELFNNLVWSQHLNHQRPDAGGRPPYADVETGRFPRGGTLAVRDPAALALLDTPFDWSARIPDVKVPTFGQVFYNLPDVAIFLWRLAAYTIERVRPVPVVVFNVPGPVQQDQAQYAVRFKVHPLGQRLQLFNTFDYDASVRPPVVTTVDGQPAPILRQRLTSGDPMGNPTAYVDLQPYDATNPNLPEADMRHGLRLYFPTADFPTLLADVDAGKWRFRGANLCAWEVPLEPPLGNGEVAIDPVIGRVVVGVSSSAQASSLLANMLVTYTYGAVGRVGAQPISRPEVGATFDGFTVAPTIHVPADAPTIAAALATLAQSPSPMAPLVVEIDDSEVHDFDPASLGASGTVTENGQVSILVGRSLILRAADGQRPIVRLAAPLAFRPTKVTGADADEQKSLDAINGSLRVRLDGLYLTPARDAAGKPAFTTLVTRVALRSLELVGTTLDPGGDLLLANSATPPRAQPIRALELAAGYGFAAPDVDHFAVTPEIHLCRSITGALYIEEKDEDYTLSLSDSIVDGAGAEFAISGVAASAATSWGPTTTIDRVTIFGRVRVEDAGGRGGIFVKRLEVRDAQARCLKYCSFSGDHDVLPQSFACVRGAYVAFTSDVFGDPAYGQLTFGTDERVRERGPQDDQMGAFGFLEETHRWKNLQIRFREFMPVGVKPLLVPRT